MKRFVSLITAFILIFSFSVPIWASDTEPDAEKAAAALWDYLDVSRFGEKAVLATDVKPEFDFAVKSVCLIEAETGTVLYESSSDVRYMPASVTKVMTLLLVFEAIDSGKIKLTDEVTASSHAAEMGGTQIYLKPEETMTVEELIKAVAIPSANDAAVALAEYVAGSEDEFVRQMNEKAKTLGLENTNFTNCTGLFDDENHYTTAYDIAIMSRELIKHEKIFDFTTVWLDSLRDGAFTLANTNKMLRTYNGMKGLKTGFTKASKYCFSGVAERNGMTLIVTVMGADTSDIRFSASASLLNFGFSNFAVAKSRKADIPEVSVSKGKKDNVSLCSDIDFSLVVPKGWENELSYDISIPEEVTAPVKKGEQAGVLTYKLKDETVKTCPIVFAEDVEKATVWDYFADMVSVLFR